MVEHSYIKSIDKKVLDNMKLNNHQINKIESFVNYAIKNHLYTNSKVLYHDLKHIEKVLIYSIWILNEREIKIKDKNLDILLYAGLFHDSGRSIGAKDKTHGLVGAKIARKKLKGIIDDKTINSIELLIETHAIKENTVNFKNYNYTLEEKKTIQLLSDILKDADALDRNRLKIFPFWKCKPKYLRTKEASDIYYYTNALYKEYYKAIKKYKKK